MVKNNWRVGDKCYMEFGLGEVKAVEKDGRVTEVFDGGGTLCSRDLRDRMFKITPKIEAISKQFKEKYSDPLYKMNCGLNMPDIHQWLVQKWVDACNGDARKYHAIKLEQKEFMTLLKHVLSTNYKGMRVFR